MNSLVSSISQKAYRIDIVSQKYVLIAFLCLFSLLLAYQLDRPLFELIVYTLSDAYFAVSVFVALTLSMVYLARRYLKADLIKLLNQNQQLQVPIATFLGVLPGCGGAIIVVTQFVRGQVSFGAFVAVLISTMGDASFLLLARAPSSAIIVFSCSIVAAILFGYIINYIHGKDFLKPSSEKTIEQENQDVEPISKKILLPWLWLLIPGVVIGILLSFQIDVDSYLGPFSHYEPTIWLGFIGAMLSLNIWLLHPFNSWTVQRVDSENYNNCHKESTLWESVAVETSFVSAWVIAGFLCFELLIFYTGWDLGIFFRTLGPTIPLFAVLIGFIPGCGPQIIMTTLYLQGIAPLSAQLANAISNDGDALFPAIAMSPTAAIYATLYSAIPALVLGYTAYGLGF